MDGVHRAVQSMTGALKGQPRTSMISHLANVLLWLHRAGGQLSGRWQAANRQLEGS